MSDKSKLLRQRRRIYAEEPQHRLLCFKRKAGEGGEAGFNNQKPTRQIYLFRHVTGGLTTKWAIEIELKHLRIMACFDFVHVLREWRLLQHTCGFHIKE